jgi:membrane peptidoglycan carboxypeptidase
MEACSIRMQPQTNQVFAGDVMADLTTALPDGDLIWNRLWRSLTGRHSAGKTGTTTANASAWFTGYDPQMAGYRCCAL